MTEREVRIESGSNGDSLRIHIRDSASGVMLAGIILDPQQIWSMLSGGTIRVGALMSNNLDRVGKTMVNESVIVTRDQLKASTHDQQEADALQLVRADRPGWDEYEARRRGGGSGSIQVVMRRWEA